MKYTTILFDADETLLDFRRAESLALPEVLQAHNLPTDADFLATYRTINHNLWEQFHRGEIEKSVITSTRFVRLFERYSIPLDGAEFNERYLDYLSMHGDLLPGADALCAALHRAGIALYITTNGIERVQTNRFERSGLAPYFQGVFVSETIGMAKPQKEFFDYVLNSIPHCEKAKTLVVGDSLTADIAGGIAAGLDTCWCDFKHTNNPHNATYRVENFAELQALLTGETA